MRGAEQTLSRWFADGLYLGLVCLQRRLHYTSQLVHCQPQLTRTRQINQTYQNFLFLATPDGSSSVKSFFGPVLAGSPMLHAQIRPKHVLLQAQTPYFSMAQSTWIFTHTTQTPVYFAVHGFADVRMTCHAPYTSPPKLKVFS